MSAQGTGDAAGNAEADASPGIVRALRDAAPYIVAHQGRTVILSVPGRILGSDGLPSFLDDVSLLGQVAGIRFAVAFDVMPQAAAIASAQGVAATALRRGRVAVGEQLLACLRQALREVREELEMILASGMHGMDGLGTVTGPPMPSHKAGVVDGTDLGFMGVPKPLSKADTDSLLKTGKIVLLPPLGSGLGGETLHLDSREVALAFAIASKSDKLVFLADEDEVSSLDFRELTLDKARERLNSGGFHDPAAALVGMGLDAMDKGVGRVHFIGADIHAGLLLELLTPDGVASMLSRDPFDAVRPATRSDVISIAELIAPGIASGAVLPRSVQELSDTIESFAVVARDDALIACASVDVSEGSAEFGCLAVRPEYANQAYGQLLLDFFEAKSKKAGAKRMIVVTTQATDWFRERGYRPGDLASLPPARAVSAKARSAIVLEKKLG